MNRITKIFIALTCIVVLYGIAIHVTVVGSGGFLTDDATSQIAALGYDAAYLITVENTEDETKTYNPTAANIGDSAMRRCMEPREDIPHGDPTIIRKII